MFPERRPDDPVFADYAMKGRTYRYITEKPMFPFGYGLSYAQIEIEPLENNDICLKENGTLVLNVKLNNKSNVDAQEVLQVYSCRLKDCGISSPNFKLCGFKCVRLKAKESKTFEVTAEEAFEFFNEKGLSEILNGDYKIYVGTSQPDERSFELTGKRPLCIDIKYSCIQN